MPLFLIKAHEIQASPTTEAPTEPPKTYSLRRYAPDPRRAAERLLQEGKRAYYLCELKGIATKPSSHVEEKRTIYRRLAQAMQHKRFSLKTTAEQLIESFPGNSRKHRAARDFLETCKNRKLEDAVQAHPHMFSEGEIEAIVGAPVQREAIKMLAQSMSDQRTVVREVGSALAWPLVNLVLFACALVFLFVSVLPSLVQNLFPYASQVPDFLKNTVALSNWLHVPLHLALALSSFAAVALFIGGIYRASPALQAMLGILVMTKLRGYGRVRHGIERRMMYQSMIHLILAKQINNLPARLSSIASPAGKEAMKATAEAKQSGDNPLVRFRAADPYLLKREIEALIAAYQEGGVGPTVDELNQIIKDIDEDIPRDIDAMKREIQIAANILIGGALALFFIGLMGSIFFTVVHLRS